jgi:hypothetical protein
MEFQPTIPAFERAKTVHALDRAATVVGFGTEWGRKKKLRVITAIVSTFCGLKPRMDKFGRTDRNWCRETFWRRLWSLREKMAWVCIRSTLNIDVKTRWPCHRFVFRVNSVAAHCVRRVRIKSWVGVSLGDVSHRHVITVNQRFCVLGQFKKSLDT